MGSTFRKGSQQSGQATGIANQTAGAFGGLQNTFFPQVEQYATTGQLPPPFNQILGQGAQDLGTQGSAARQSILDTGARGGALEAALTQAQAQRMQGLDALRAQLGGQLYGQGLLGALNPSGTLGAAGILSQLGQQRIGQNQAFQSGLGSLAGLGLGGAAMYGLPAPGAGTLGAAKLGGK